MRTKDSNLIHGLGTAPTYGFECRRMCETDVSALLTFASTGVRHCPSGTAENRSVHPDPVGYRTEGWTDDGQGRPDGDRASHESSRPPALEARVILRVRSERMLGFKRSDRLIDAVDCMDER